MTNAHRSGCPINLSLKIFGDKWSLLILRDMIFGGRRHFRELLNGSQEGIASNILANRLKRLVELGMLTKRDDPAHKQKAIYSLTEPSIELVPIMAALGTWGRKWLPVSEELAVCDASSGSDYRAKRTYRRSQASHGRRRAGLLFPEKPRGEDVTTKLFEA